MRVQNIAAADQTVNVVDQNVEPHVATVEHERLHCESLLKVTLFPCFPVLVQTAAEHGHQLDAVDEIARVSTAPNLFGDAQDFFESERNIDHLSVPLSVTEEG